jgi:hypothetical protein
MAKNMFATVVSYPAEVAGRWWLPGRREEGELQATLIIDEAGATSLRSDVVAPLTWYGQGEGFDADWLYVDAIHGEFGLRSRPVTLLGCQITTLAPGVSTLWVDADSVIDGLWVESFRHAVFTSAEVELENLGTWAQFRTLRQQLGPLRHQLKPPADRQEKPILFHTPAETREARIDGATIKLSCDTVFSEESTATGRDVRLTERWSFQIVTQPPVGVERMWNTAGVLQDFITFATGRASAFTGFTLQADAAAVAQVSDAALAYPKATLHMPGRVSPKSSGPAAPARERAFALADLQFDELIPRWFAMRDRFRAVLGVVLGQHYLPRQYPETRLGMAVAAAEEVHRAAGFAEKFMTDSQRQAAQKIAKQAFEGDARFAEHARRIATGVDNRFTLDERLRKLVTDLGDAGTEILGDHVDTWVEAAKKARNDIAHTGATAKYNQLQLGRLAAATIAIIELLILKKLGFNDKHLMSVVAIGRHRHVRDSLGQAFPCEEPKAEPESSLE